MTNQELKQLWETSYARSRELELIYRIRGTLTRQECNELRHCTMRLGIVARESWIAAGRPDDPEFEVLQQPIKLSPLPASMRPIDLTDRSSTEIH